MWRGISFDTIIMFRPFLYISVAFFKGKKNKQNQVRDENGFYLDK